MVNLLREQRQVLAGRTGIDFELRHVVVKGREDYPPNHGELPMSLDANAAIDDPKSEVVIELIGGTGVAGTLIERALKLGKPVVTSNSASIWKMLRLMGDSRHVPGGGRLLREA